MTRPSTDRILSEIAAYARERKLTSADMARRLDIPESTFRGWIAAGPGRARPSRRYVLRMEDFLRRTRDTRGPAGAGEDGPLPPATRAERSARKIKHLLLLLEDELRAFRDGPGEAREVVRAEMDPDDVGYISSLLNMLGDERKFVRWRELTSNRFNGFRRRPGRGADDDGDEPGGPGS
jgi:hypothetical protein